MEFWHAFGIVIAAILLGVGIIMGWYWLVTIGFIGLPLALVWGLVVTGPGSPHNPYQQH